MRKKRKEICEVRLPVERAHRELMALALGLADSPLWMFWTLPRLAENRGEVPRRGLLIAAPPDAFARWREVLAGYSPPARVVEVRGESDLAVEGDIYLLPLDALVLRQPEPVLPSHCPRCGSSIDPADPGKAVEGVLCSALVPRPKSFLARVLAEVLVPVALAHPAHVQWDLLPRALRRWCPSARPRPLSIDALVEAR